MAVNEERAGKLYRALTDKGLNIGSEQHFMEAMGDENRRRRFYDQVTQKGYNIGTYDHFNNAMWQTDEPAADAGGTVARPDRTAQSGEGAVTGRHADSEQRTANSEQRTVGSGQGTGGSGQPAGDGRARPKAGWEYRSPLSGVNTGVGVVDNIAHASGAVAERAYNQRTGIGVIDDALDKGTRLMTGVHEHAANGGFNPIAEEAKMHTDPEISQWPEWLKSEYRAAGYRDPRNQQADEETTAINAGVADVLEYSLEGIRNDESEGSEIARGIADGDYTAFDAAVGGWFNDLWNARVSELHEENRENWGIRTGVAGGEGHELASASGAMMEQKRSQARLLDPNKIAANLQEKVPAGAWDAIWHKELLEVLRAYPTLPVEDYGKVRDFAINRLANRIYNASWHGATEMERRRMEDQGAVVSAIEKALDSTLQGNLTTWLASADGQGLAPTMQARELWSQDHWLASALGTAAGMSMDVAMIPAMGAGSAVGSAVGKTVLGRAAMQAVGKTTGQKALGYAAKGAVAGLSGGANFATYSGLSDIGGQLAQTGHVDLMQTLGSTVEGAALGFGLGMLGTGTRILEGNATRGITSHMGEGLAGTGANLAAKTAIKGAGFGAEAALFSIPEVMQGEDWGDALAHNMGVVAGFKIWGAAKGAAGFAAHGMGKAIDNQFWMGMDKRTRAERRRQQGIWQNIKDRINQVPDLGMTADERRELEEAGYGDVYEMNRKRAEGEAVEGNIVERVVHDLEMVEDGMERQETVGSEQLAANSEQRTGDSEQLTANSWQEMGKVTVDGVNEYYDRVTAMLNDPNVSWTAKAKMYWIVTGRQLAVPAILDSRIEETDGGYKVVGLDSQGGKVMERTYTSESAAEEMHSRLQHQKELNEIDIAEQKQSLGLATSAMMDACTQIAAEVGLEGNPAGLAHWYGSMKEMEMSGIVLRPGDRELVARIDRAYAEAVERQNAVNGNNATAQRIEREHGVSVDEALKKTAGERTDSERAAVAEYRGALEEEQRTVDSEQRTGGSEQGAVGIVEASRKTQEKFVEAGYGISSERRMVEVERKYNEARAAAEEALGDEAMRLNLDDINELIDEKSAAGETATANALRGLRNAEAIRRGARQRMDDDAEANLAANYADLEACTHTDGQSVRGVAIKGEQRAEGESCNTFLVEGDVVMREDGQGIDYDKSTPTVVVYDRRTGVATPYAVTDITEAFRPVSVEDNRRMLKDESARRKEARAARIEQEAANSEQRTGDSEQGIANRGQRTGGSEQRTAESEQRTGDRRQWGAGTFKLDGEDCELLGYDRETGMWEYATRSEIERWERSGRRSQPQTHAVSEEWLNENAKDFQAYEEAVGSEERTANSGQETGDRGQRTANSEQRTGDSEQRTGDRGLGFEVGDEVTSNSGRRGVVKEVKPEGIVTVEYEDGEVWEFNEEYGDITNSGLRKIGREQRTGDSEQRTANSGQRTAESGQETAALERVPRNAKGKPEFAKAESAEDGWDALVEYYAGKEQTADSEQRTGDSEQRTGDSGQRTGDSGEGTANRSVPIPSEGAMEMARKHAEIELKRAQDAEKGVSKLKQGKNEDTDDYLMRMQAAEADAKAAVKAWEDILGVPSLRERQQALEAQAQRNANRSQAVGAVITERWDGRKRVVGKESEFVLQDGRRVKGHWEVVEAGSATSSHDALNGYAKSEGFPTDRNGESVNDRDYEHEKSAQEHTEAAAAAYDERALQDRVVVSSDGVVLSGNERNMARILSARGGTDGKYVEYVRNNPEDWRIDREALEDIEHPQVVFVLDETLPYDAATFNMFNKSEKKSQSYEHQSVAIGKMMSDDTYSEVLNITRGYETLGELYKDRDKGVLNLLNLLTDSGVITQEQRKMFVDRDGTLTGTGQDMIEAMLIGKAFDGKPEVIAQINAVRTMRQAIISALPEIGRNRALQGGYDLAGELENAISLVYHARGSRLYNAGGKVSEYAKQRLLMEDEKMDAYRNATVMLLADVLNSTKPTELRRVLTGYNQQGKDAASGQLVLNPETFEMAVRSKNEIIKDVLRAAGVDVERVEADAVAAAKETGDKRHETGDSEQRTVGSEQRTGDSEQPAVGSGEAGDVAAGAGLRGGGEGYGDAERQSRSEHSATAVGEQEERRVDRQSNPVDSEGRLVVEKVASVDDITDEDFNAPTRTIEMPETSDELNSLLPINGRRVVIKKSTFEKNLREHPELSPEQSKAVLGQALYSTDMIVQDKPTGKPNYWILVKVGEHNALVNVDTDPKKDNVEVVGWRLVREKSLEQIKNRANRDGGQIIMTREGAAGLSALTTESVSTGKGSELGGEKQGEGGESSIPEDTADVRKSTDEFEVEMEREARLGELKKKAEEVFFTFRRHDIPDELLEKYADEIEGVVKLEEAFSAVQSEFLKYEDYGRGEHDPYKIPEWQVYREAARELEGKIRGEMNAAALERIMEGGVDGKQALAGVKPRLKKRKVADFVSKDASAGAMTGVYHHDGRMAATDTHVLVDVEADYDSALEGKIIGKNGKEIEARFPAIDKIFEQRGLKSVRLDVKDALGVAAALAQGKARKEPTAFVVIEGVPYDANWLVGVLQIADKYGLDRVRHNGDSMLVIEGERGRVAVMGTWIENIKGKTVYDMTTGKVVGLDREDAKMEVRAGGEQEAVNSGEETADGRQERFAELRERMKAKLRGGSQQRTGDSGQGAANSGQEAGSVQEPAQGYGDRPKMDGEMLQIGIEMTEMLVEDGHRGFEDYCRVMIDEIGEEIKPYLKQLYGAVLLSDRAHSEGWAADMSKPEDVRGFDVLNLGREQQPASLVERAAHMAKENEIEEQVQSLEFDAENKRELCQRIEARLMELAEEEEEGDSGQRTGDSEQRTVDSEQPAGGRRDETQEELTPEDIRSRVGELQSMYEELTLTFGEDTEDENAVSLMNAIANSVRRWRAKEVVVASAAEEIADSEQRTANRGQRTVDSEQRTVGGEQRTGDGIQDWGEKIHGARKDALQEIASKMANITAADLVANPISKVFKAPDWQKSVAKGDITAEDARVLEAISRLILRDKKPAEVTRSRFAARARDGEIRKWAERTAALIDGLRRFASAETVEERRMVLESIGAIDLEEEKSRRAYVVSLNPDRVDGGRYRPNELQVVLDVIDGLGYPTNPVGKAKFSTIETDTFGTTYRVRVDGHYQGAYATYEEAIARAVKLAKVTRGDSDVEYTPGDFRVGVKTSRAVGKGTYNVWTLKGRYETKTLATGLSKEEAERLADEYQKKHDKPASVSEERDRVNTYGAEVRDPYTGKSHAIEGVPEFQTAEETRAWIEDSIDELQQKANEVISALYTPKGKAASAHAPVEVGFDSVSRSYMVWMPLKGRMASALANMEVFASGFATRREAAAWLQVNQPMIDAVVSARKEAMRKFTYFEPAKERRGRDHRGGRDVRENELGETFGFRGVQFGNWTNQRDRQMAVNEAYDSLMDLAEVLGVSPRSIGLGGELGLAFGSRGSGSANAHYEPTEVVINLTKTRGAGSLAHEWWHALDNYFARRGGIGTGMMTDGVGVNERVRPEIIDAYKEVVRAIRGTAYDRRSIGRGEYWGSMVEETARLFAEWVNLKLADRDAHNSFLSRGIEPARVESWRRMMYEDYRQRVMMQNGEIAKQNETLDEDKKMPLVEMVDYSEFREREESLQGFPYPTEREIREQFDGPMQRLFDVIEEEKLPDGSVALAEPGAEYGSAMETPRTGNDSRREKAERIEKLRRSEPVTISGNEISFTGNEKQDRKNALEYGKKHQGSYTNKDTGSEIQLQRGRRNGGINEVLQHNYKDKEHLQSVAAIPQIIEEGIYLTSEPNKDEAKNPNIAEYQHYVCGLRIGKEDYTVHSIIAIDKNGNRYYDHNLTHIEKGKLLDQINDGQAVEINGFGTMPGTKPTTNSERKVQNLISILQINNRENEGRIAEDVGGEVMEPRGRRRKAGLFEDERQRGLFDGLEEEGTVGSEQPTGDSEQPAVGSEQRTANSEQLAGDGRVSLPREDASVRWERMERMSEEAKAERGAEIDQEHLEVLNAIEEAGYTDQALQEGLGRLADMWEQLVAMHGPEPEGFLDGMRMRVLEEDIKRMRIELAKRAKEASPGMEIYVPADGIPVEYKQASKRQETADRGQETADSGQRTGGRRQEMEAMLTSPLPSLDASKGEFCFSEMQFVKEGFAGFTSDKGGRIETAEDVAYMFRKLESAEHESVFAVLVKDSESIVLHLGTGAQFSASCNLAMMRAGIERVAPDEVYIVHNHPSGTMRTSAEDEKLLRRAKESFAPGMDKDKVHGIVIDTWKHEYLTFGDGGSEVKVRRDGAESGQEMEVQTWSAEKSPFNMDYKPDKPIMGSEDVARLISNRRLADSGKVGYIIVDRANNPVANICTDMGKLTSDGVKDLSEEIHSNAVRFGGSGVIMYGSDASMNSEPILRALSGRLRDTDVNLMDSIYIKGRAQGFSGKIGQYRSAAEEGKVYEPGIPAGDRRQETEVRDPAGTMEGLWGDDMGLGEKVTRGAVLMAERNREDFDARERAVRSIGGNLRELRRAMSKQKEYDRSTVKRMTDLVKILMGNGYLRTDSKAEISRLLNLVRDNTGKNDLKAGVDKLMDMVIQDQMRIGEEMHEKLIRKSGTKINASGVEVQGKVDAVTSELIGHYRDAIKMTEADILDMIDQAEEALASGDTIKSENAALRKAAYELALQYNREITERHKSEVTMRNELNEAEEDKRAGRITAEEYRQLKEAIEDSIRENRIELAEAWQAMNTQIGQVIQGGVERAKAFRAEEKERVERIHHLANSDMEGRKADAHRRDSIPDRTLNAVTSVVNAPLGTFDMMLRTFGNKSVDGQGYLWDEYMRRWVSSREQEIIGVRSKYEAILEKAAEIFGKKGMTWAQLLAKSNSGAKTSVTFRDGNKEVTKELTQGNLLYIYMVDKMTDGRMKLRKMGIDETKTAQIAAALDPKLKEFGDWVQEEFLSQTREEYNETHKRMYGASMAAIDNYFPLRILKESLEEKANIDEGDREDVGIGATMTGSIKKRSRNSLPLDITNTDAISVLLDHIAEMEHWSAFAEWGRDLNTLLNYKRFRAQVKNMHTRYGTGNTLWKNFKDVCRIAAGTYHNATPILEKGLMSMASGATAAKVAFRLNTALKQLLSAPAYLGDISAAGIAEIMRHPENPWRWSMENLPIFKERWASRMAGDPRLRKTQGGWLDWRKNMIQAVGRAGMAPNAFVDAVTVSMGAYAMYKSAYARYKKMGYSDAMAELRAKQDSTILYNQSQQSSEGAFMSRMQADKTWLSTLLTVFRNAPMSYTRKFFDSVGNLRRMLRPGYKERSLEYMAKQMMRDGLDEAHAKAAAQKKYRHEVSRDLVNMAVYGFVLSALWNIGGHWLTYLISDNDEEKDKLTDDILARLAYAPFEGLPAGDVMSNFVAAMITGEGFNGNTLTKEMPVTSDIAEAVEAFQRGNIMEGVHDMISLAGMTVTGVDIKTAEGMVDGVLQMIDACQGDVNLAHEAAIIYAKITNCPPSQIRNLYLDDIDLSGEQAARLTPAQVAERYAEMQVRRGRPIIFWGDVFGRDEEKEKAKASVMKEIRERARATGDERLNEQYNHIIDTGKEVEKEVTRLRKQYREGQIGMAELSRGMAALQNDRRRWAMYLLQREADSYLGRLVSAYMRAGTAHEANEAMREILEFKRRVVGLVSF